MRNKSKLFYKLGSYVLLLFGAVHTVAFFTDPAKLLTDEESKKVWQLIDTHQFNIEGMVFTIRSLMLGFNWYLEVFTLGLGVLNLLIARQLAEQVSSLRLMAVANVVIVGLLVVVTAIYFHLPPLVLFGFSWLFFLASLLTAKENKS
ncbi:MAG: LIC_13387 family protein [bacterium]